MLVGKKNGTRNRAKRLVYRMAGFFYLAGGIGLHGKTLEEKRAVCPIDPESSEFVNWNDGAISQAKMTAQREMDLFR